MSAARKLAYAYLTLPFHVQVKVARKMGVIVEGLSWAEMNELLFSRAKRMNEVDKLTQFVTTEKTKLNT